MKGYSVHTHKLCVVECGKGQKWGFDSVIDGYRRFIIVSSSACQLKKEIHNIGLSTKERGDMIESSMLFYIETSLVDEDNKILVYPPINLRYSFSITMSFVLSRRSKKTIPSR